jgi:ribonuclease D
LNIVAQAEKVDPEQWPRHDKVDSLSKQQQALGDCLMALCRVIADENDISLATLALRKDIDNLILNHKSSRLTQGWRFSMAGEKLLEFIHGQTVVSVDDDQLRLEPRQGEHRDD